MRDQKVLLEDILSSIEIIEGQMKDADESKFKESIPFQDAVIRRLSIIGEVSKNVTKELKDKHRDINWKNIAGMRDLIVHEYFDMDLDLVWNTIKIDLPVLKKTVTEMLKESK